MLTQSLTTLVTGANNAFTSLFEKAASIVSPQRRTDDEIRQELVALHGVPHDHSFNILEGKIN